MVAGEDHIRALEERAFNAWPALQTIVADGWLLRFANGYTKRANSLNAWRPSCPIGHILPEARALYEAHGLPMIARLSPLAGSEADTELADQGYLAIDETIVMTAPLAASPLPDPGPRIERTPNPEWLDGFAAANAVEPERRTIHDRMLASIVPSAAFATMHREAVPACWGLAVAERGCVGLFDIVTAPAARRLGIARGLVQGLMSWGAASGAHTAYLQVVATNTPAIRLYAALGFREAYRYHYRIAPAAG